MRTRPPGVNHRSLPGSLLRSISNSLFSWTINKSTQGIGIFSRTSSYSGWGIQPFIELILDLSKLYVNNIV
ncbi:MAG: hypothetical protein ACTSXT_03110 [Candidatus Helarchaeota archaeon]